MKNLLLDTHIVLWIANNPSKLTDKAMEALSGDAVKCVSIASAWEVVIKLGKNKPDNIVLDLPGGLAEFYRILDFNGFLVLPVEREYLLHIPFLPTLHKDPFDRLIISTAITEELTLITADEDIQKYDIPWIW